MEYELLFLNPNLNDLFKDGVIMGDGIMGKPRSMATASSFLKKIRNRTCSITKHRCPIIYFHCIPIKNK